MDVNGDIQDLTVMDPRLCRSMKINSRIEIEKWIEGRVRVG